jgi:exonuclease III
LNITSSQLKIAHLNVRSLRNIAHLTDVKELVNLHKIDIFTISETWLNSTVTNSEIAIEDYKIYRLDRLHKRGGGVCAYIKKNIKESVLNELSQISESRLWINIQSKRNRSIIICVTYRPPDCSLNCFEDHF